MFLLTRRCFLRLLYTALFFNEHRDLVKQPNERFEFLGDSVLGLIVSDFLYHNLPNNPEGELSHLRAQIVEAGACANFLQKLGVRGRMCF